MIETAHLSDNCLFHIVCGQTDDILKVGSWPWLYVTSCDCTRLFLIRSYSLFRKLRRVCQRCFLANQKQNSEQVRENHEIDEDFKSDGSDVSSRRGSVLSTDIGGLDHSNRPSSSPQCGMFKSYLKWVSFTRILCTFFAFTIAVPDFIESPSLFVPSLFRH